MERNDKNYGKKNYRFTAVLRNGIRNFFPLLLYINKNNNNNKSNKILEPTFNSYYKQQQKQNKQQQPQQENKNTHAQDKIQTFVWGQCPPELHVDNLSY